jgi:hypothetical protein
VVIQFISTFEFNLFFTSIKNRVNKTGYPECKNNMNSKALKEAEKRFLHRFSGGFTHPEMDALGKKHKVTKLVELAQNNLKKNNFDDVDFILSEIIRIVSRSSMVSMFEKPKFKNMIASLVTKDKKNLLKHTLIFCMVKKNMGLKR